MATIAMDLTHTTTPKTMAFKSVRPTEFSNLACRVHTHSKPMIQTVLRGELDDQEQEPSRRRPRRPGSGRAPARSWLALEKFVLKALK